MSLTPPNLSNVSLDPSGLGFDPAKLRRLDAHFDQYVAAGRLPGWSVAVGRAGQVAHVGTGGYRDLASEAPMTLDTVVRIYSMTKPVTSVAAMMLYERGGFELTDPISKFLPAFADMRVFVGGSSLRPATVPATEPIRVWHVLTHTAGLVYGFQYASAVDAMYRAAGYEFALPAGCDLAAGIDGLAGLPLLFQPGAEWNYSMATDVLGRLVEVWSGMSLDQALAELIFAPLAMTETGFRVGLHARDRFATLYSPGPGGALRVNAALGDAFFEPSWLSGGGGLVSTLGDCLRFAEMLRGRGAFAGQRLLGSRTFDLMVGNHLPGGQDLATFGRPLNFQTPFDGVGFGLGFAVTVDPVATHSLGSIGEFGWGGAASTHLLVDPREDITIVFLAQLLPANTYPIRSQLRQLVYAALVD